MLMLLAFDGFQQRTMITHSRGFQTLPKLGTLQALLIALAASLPSTLHAQESRRTACANALRESANVAREVGDLMEADADDVAAHGGAMGPMMTQQFVNWYQTKRARDSANYPDLTNTAPTYEARVLRQRAADDFMAERQRGYRARIEASRAKVARICPSELIPK